MCLIKCVDTNNFVRGKNKENIHLPLSVLIEAIVMVVALELVSGGHWGSVLSLVDILTGFNMGYVPEWPRADSKIER